MKRFTLLHGIALALVFSAVGLGFAAGSQDDGAGASDAKVVAESDAQVEDEIVFEEEEGEKSGTATETRSEDEIEFESDDEEVGDKDSDSTSEDEIAFEETEEKGTSESSAGDEIKFEDEDEDDWETLEESEDSAASWLDLPSVDIDQVRKDAEGGDASAQVALGRCYETGNGVARDWKKALSWYRKAAKQDEPEGLFHVGYCYLHGVGVSIDLERAAKYLQKASDKGSGEAMGALARLLVEGYSPEEDSYVDRDEIDEDQILELARKATETSQGFEGSLVLYAYSSRDGDEEKATEYLDAAMKILEKRIAEGDPVAEYQAWEEGAASPKLEKLRFPLLKDAAKKGLPAAQNSLGIAYFFGSDFVEADESRAADYFEKASKKNFLPAIQRLGICYYAGHGRPKDCSRAVDLFATGAEMGYAESLHSLGVCLAAGPNGGVEKRDYQTAFECFEMAALRGSAPAQFKMGYMLVEGLGRAKDPEPGYGLILIACDQEDEDARKYVIGYFTDYLVKTNPKNADRQLLEIVKEHVKELEEEGETELAKFYKDLIKTSRRKK